MQARTMSLLTLAVAGALFADLFLHWFGPGGHEVAGWSVPLEDFAGLLALGVVLVETARLAQAWSTRASELVCFFVAAGAALVALSGLIDLRWGGIAANSFGDWVYGAWIGLALAIVLLTLAAFRLLDLRPVESSRPM